MKEIIKNLDAQIVEIAVERNRAGGNNKEHGSLEQTRDILFESIYQQAIDHLDAARNQLKILERELF